MNNAVAEFFLSRGKARFYLGRFDQAKDDYRQAVFLSPELEEAQLLLLQYNNDEETRKRVEADRNATIQRHLHKSVKEALAPLYSKVTHDTSTHNSDTPSHTTSPSFSTHPPCFISHPLI